MTTLSPSKTGLVNESYNLPFGFQRMPLSQRISGVHNVFQSKANDYGRPYDFKQSVSLAEAYQLESLRFIDQAIKNTSPSQLKELLQTHRLGPLEEGGDTLWELYLYRAIKKGVITPKKVYQVRQEIIDPMRAAALSSNKRPRHTYKDVIQAIESSIPRKDIKKFKRISGAPSENIARQQLAMGIFKYAILDGKSMEDAYKIKGKTYQFAVGEAEEFKESIEHRHGLAKHFVMPYFRLFLLLPFIPGTLATLLPLYLVRQSTGAPIPRRELLDYEFLKQLFRQELHYNLGGGDKGEKPTRQNPFAYDVRKALYKPVEALLEAWRINSIGKGTKGDNPDKIYCLC